LPDYQTRGTVSSLYAQPALKFKELLDTFEDGRDIGFDFLSAYWNAYRYRQVDTKEFVRFTKTYFKLDDDFFDWLKL
jgi:hypothetical protein